MKSMTPPETAPPFVFNEPGENPHRFSLWARVRGFVLPALLCAAFVAPMPERGRLLGLPTLCMFRYLTGLPCPGCGLTRSCVCFAHGHFGESLAYHPLGPLVFLTLAFLGLLRLPFVRQRFAFVSPRFGEVAAYGATGLFLAAWAARLLGFVPPLP